MTAAAAIIPRSRNLAVVTSQLSSATGDFVIVIEHAERLASTLWIEKPSSQDESSEDAAAAASS